MPAPIKFLNKVSESVGEILIYDEIGFWGITAKMFRDELASLGNVSEIIVRINSGGGSVIDGNAIYNMLKEHTAKKTVKIDGWAASIASVIAMAGDTIEMAENTLFMIHNPYAMTVGDAEQLRKEANLLDKMKENAITAYMSKNKVLSREEIATLMNDETYMTAQEAKDKGFIDTITDAIPEDSVMLDNGKKILMRARLSHAAFVNKTGERKIGSTPTAATPINKGALMNKCKHCGQEIAEGAFCSHCGKAQADPVASAIAREQAEARIEAAKMATERAGEIFAMCEHFGLDKSYRETLLKSDKDLASCKGEILDKVASALPPAVQGVQLSVGADESDKFRSQAVLAISQVQNLASVDEKKEKVSADAPRSLSALQRVCLRKANPNAKVDTMTAHDLAVATLRMAAQGSSDFTAILADVANKSLLKGFNEAPVTYRQWCGSGTVRDFKTTNLTKLSNFGDIELIPEGANFTQGRLSDKKETVSLSTKGKMFSLTRQALINDDLNAFVSIPGKVMGAVARAINKDVYDVLTSASLAGPTMVEDSKVLFATGATTHGNLGTAGALAVGTLDELNEILMTRPLIAPDGKSVVQYSNNQGRFVITGTKNNLLVKQTIGSSFDISKAIAGVPNPYNYLEPVIDAYLQAKFNAAGKASAYYMATDYNMVETIGVFTLEGNSVPTLRSEPSSVGEALGINWDIFFDWGIAVPDWRGLALNKGA